jgi:hypothetical protein
MMETTTSPYMEIAKPSTLAATERWLVVEVGAAEVGVAGENSSLHLSSSASSSPTGLVTDIGTQEKSGGSVVTVVVVVVRVVTVRVDVSVVVSVLNGVQASCLGRSSGVGVTSAAPGEFGTLLPESLLPEGSGGV